MSTCPACASRIAGAPSGRVEKDKNAHKERQAERRRQDDEGPSKTALFLKTEKNPGAEVAATKRKKKERERER